MKNRLTNLSLLITVLIVVVVNFLTQPAWILAGDPVCVRLETANLLAHGRFGLDKAEVVGERGQYFFENVRSGRWYPKYGVLNTLIYLPALALERQITGGREAPALLRLVILNLHNLVLTAVCAALLHTIAGLFTRSGLARLIFTLSCIYATFFWFYTRGQSFEIHQTLLFLAAAWCALKGGQPQQTRPAAWMAGAGTFLGLLILAKAVYVVAAPVFMLYAGLCAWEGRKPDGGWKSGMLRSLAGFAIPFLIGFGALLAANTIRFDSPFNLGYAQWGREAAPMSGDPLTAIQGYLFSSQFSIFAAFPPLVLALFYWRAFFRKNRTASFLAIGLFLVLLVVNAFFVNWAGHWSYGPRYLLPALPLVSLPFVSLLDSVASPRGLRRHVMAAAAAICVLLVSLTNQLAVNRFMFFFHYHLEYSVFVHASAPKVTAYLRERPAGLIALEFSRWLNGTARFEPLEDAAEKMNPAERQKTEELLRLFGSTNFLFLSFQWRDPVATHQ